MKKYLFMVLFTFAGTATSLELLPEVDDVGLFGLDEAPVGYTIEYIYRMALEYEFYVLPSNEAEHQEAIDNLVQIFSTTKKRLIDELVRSRSAKKATYRSERRITKITSTPLKKGRFITPSTETFSLCIFSPEAPHFGFRKQTYQEAQETLEKIKKVNLSTSGGWDFFNDWRIPTLKELFVITQYLPFKKRAGKTGYFFWSSNFTAEKNRWTIRKFPTRFDRQGQPLNYYGIDFVSTERKTDLALLVAVRDCR